MLDAIRFKHLLLPLWIGSYRFAGKPYRIVCEEGDIRVISSGSDKQEGTADDIRDNFKPSDVKRVAAL